MATGQYVVPRGADFCVPVADRIFPSRMSGGQGQTFLGFDTYTATDASEIERFAFTSAASVSIGQQLVATATDNNGNTSEFSGTVALQAPSCSTVVSNTTDTDTGSLRSAITNSRVGIDLISFNIPGSGVQTIRPADVLR